MGARGCNYCGSLHPEDFAQTLQEHPDSLVYRKHVVLECDRDKLGIAIPDTRGGTLARFTIQHGNAVLREALRRMFPDDQAVISASDVLAEIEAGQPAAA